MASSMGNNLFGRAVTKRIVTALLRRVAKRVAAASIAKYVPLAGSGIAATIAFGAMKLVGIHISMTATARPRLWCKQRCGQIGMTAYGVADCGL